MALYRCNKCGHLSEHAENLIGSRHPCPACGTDNQIYPTVGFVQTLLERYFSTRKELVATQQELAALKARPAETPSADLLGGHSGFSLPMDFDPGNTDHFCSKVQIAPVVDWFRQRQLHADLDPRSMDTSGHFDEVSGAIGNGYRLLGEIIARICTAQKQDYSFINLDLSKRPPPEAQAMHDFCQILARNRFLAKYLFQEKDQLVRLSLQKTPEIRHFFDGGWLGWFSFMQSLRHLIGAGTEFSVAREVTLSWPKDDGHTIDVFYLIDGAPLCIQCRVGDPTNHMDRLVHLRDRLGISPENYLLVTCDLTDKQNDALRLRHGVPVFSPAGFQAMLQSRFPGRH